MDATGAVLLSDRVTTSSVDSLSQSLDREWGWDIRYPLRSSGPADSIQWVFAASALQALTIHVRRDRGAVFGVDTRDIANMTVRQLAALIRLHKGSLGQGFEFAVADALNCDYQPVRNAVVESLQSVGVTMTQPRAIVMGLEKITDRQLFADAAAEALGDRRLRSGSRGRPRDAARAVHRLLAEGSSIRQHRGALAFSDLLIYDESGSDVVTASVKINGCGGYRVPDDPPRLWIIGRSPRVTDRLPSQAAVAVVDDRTLSLYEAAHHAVTRALENVDRARRAAIGPGTRMIARVVWERRDSPVEMAIVELQERAQKLADAYGRPELLPPSVATEELAISALVLPSEFPQLRGSETDSGLAVLTSPMITPSRQFFTRTTAYMPR